MRRSLVAGNWKMNGSRQSVERLVKEVAAGLPAEGGSECVICPPFVYLNLVVEALKGTDISVGAQNLSAEAQGAFTGEISGEMLRDIGCRHVIVGHSERRNLYGESDELVADKQARVLDEGLVPIACVGEKLEEREAGETELVIGRQIDELLSGSGAAGLERSVVAYEPVWAIGTGKTATPDQAQAVHAFIRQRVASHDAVVAERLRILYGGSVKGSNAAALFAMEDIDGGLIGGASLNAEEFLTICRAAG